MYDASCQRTRIRRFIPHPCYYISCCNDHDDICIAEMEQPIALSAYVKVAGLHGSLELPVGSPVKLVGTGASEHGSGVLREVQVPTVSKAECMRQDPWAVNHNMINYDDVICTGGETGKDSCGGDSGSPVLGCYGGEDWLLGVLVKGTELPSVGPACGATGRHAVY